MCGRYASSRSADDLTAHFDARDETHGELREDFNVAPTRSVPAVLTRHPRHADDEPVAEAVRSLRLVRWGLIPSWAKEASIGSRLINARMETLAEKPAFRRALKARRCLLPADGYFEWFTQPDGTKQPFFLRPIDGSPLVMAGLYEIWRDPASEDPEARVWSATIITTTAADDVGHIHDRSPMTVPREAWAAWLDPDVEDPGELLVPAASGRLEAYPVSTKVNSVKNNGPELLERIAAAGAVPEPGTLFD